MIIGYIGLGAMGKPLALRLANKYELHVWDLNARACADAERSGAHIASSIHDLALRCDVVILCLPRSENVRQVVFGPDGLMQGLSPGKIIVDQTSGVPAETRSIAEELAQRGVAMLDAPVAGGVPAAQAGTITIMVSGSKGAFQRVSGILETISPNVFYCGDRVGDGQAIKLLNNVMNAACRVSTLEAVALGTKLGLSLETLATVLNDGSARSKITQSVLPALVQGKPATDFALSLMVKDVRQAADLGLQTGVPMPLSTLALGLLQSALNTLGADARLEDVPRWILSMAGTQFIHDQVNPACEVPSDSSPSVGFVGLNPSRAMMVRRIMQHRRVYVFGSAPELLEDLVSEGAIAAKDFRSLIATCDVIIVGAGAPETWREMLTDNDELTRIGRPGTIVVDQQEGEPSAAGRTGGDLSALGMTLIDAPASSSPHEVDPGNSVTYCGGTHAGYASVLPTLELISSKVVHCGEVGSGRLADLLQSKLYACNWLIAKEAIAVGVKLGLKLEDIAKVIKDGSGWSYAFDDVLDALTSKGGRSSLPFEDVANKLDLIGRCANNAGIPLLVAGAARNIFRGICNELNGAQDFDAMTQCVEARGEVRLVSASDGSQEKSPEC
jgi:3-hydroxyisobutyrate dehydrogenase